MAVTVTTSDAGSELLLTGSVGDFGWGEDCFTHPDIVAALAQVGAGPITVRLNSGGGIAAEGAAIYAALKAHKGAVTVMIEGWAASAASLVAMAGSAVVMRPGAVLMIHDPASIARGPAAEMRRVADVLDVLGDTYAGIYAAKCGKPAAETRDLMRKEVWYGPDDAVAAGFADRAESANDNALPAEPVAFGGFALYGRLPEQVAAVATARGWQSRITLAAAPAVPPQPKEKTMSEQQPPAGPGANPPPSSLSAADPAAIAEACHAAGFPVLTASLLKRGGVTMAQVEARIADAKAIAEAAQKTGLPQMAGDLIAAGISLDTARTLLLSARASSEERAPTDTTHSAPAAATGAAQMEQAVARANELAGFSRK